MNQFKSKNTMKITIVGTDYEDGFIKKHHEDNTSFRTGFIKDVELLVAGFTVNPFEVILLQLTTLQFSLTMKYVKI